MAAILKSCDTPLFLSFFYKFALSISATVVTNVGVCDACLRSLSIPPLTRSSKQVQLDHPIGIHCTKKSPDRDDSPAQ